MSSTVLMNHDNHVQILGYKKLKSLHFFLYQLLVSLLSTYVQFNFIWVQELVICRFFEVVDLITQISILPQGLAAQAVLIREEIKRQSYTE